MTGRAPGAGTTSPPAAALADGLALILFVVVGAASHGEGAPTGAMMRTGLPLLATWFVVSVIVGTYRRVGVPSLLVTWVVAIPMAVIVRSALGGGPWDRAFLTFFAVAAVFTLCFLLAGRVIARILGRLRGRSLERAPR